MKDENTTNETIKFLGDQQKENKSVSVIQCSQFVIALYFFPGL